MNQRTDVLVAGGGLAGLVLAVALARAEIAVTVVEKRPEASDQPRAMLLPGRVMELFRLLGLEPAIRTARTGSLTAPSAWGRCLADPDIELDPAAALEPELGPCRPVDCDQSALEPILRDRARALGVTFATGWAVTGLRQDPLRAIAELTSHTGDTRRIEAQYVALADGAGSRLARELLGIGFDGSGLLERRIDILFDSDIAPEVQGQKIGAATLTDLGATLVPRPNGAWVMRLRYLPEPFHAEDIDDALCRDLVLQATGDEDVQVEFVSARNWDVRALLAGSFRRGRAFLVGDAAHAVPPGGGYGVTLAVEGAMSLGWRLAAALRLRGEEAVLDGYEAERRPIAALVLDQALARLEGAEALPPEQVVYGATPEGFIDPAEVRGEPGRRLPHMLVTPAGSETRVPLMDLCASGFVLITRDPIWIDAARGHHGLRALRIGEHVSGESLAAALGIGWRGAILVRPDGIVAWRTIEAEQAPEQLAEALGTLGLPQPAIEAA